MQTITTIGLDIAKSVFQVHGGPFCRKTLRPESSMPIRTTKTVLRGANSLC